MTPNTFYRAHRDGRHVTLYADGRFARCGSERAVTAALRKMIYRRTT